MVGTSSVGKKKRGVFASIQGAGRTREGIKAYRRPTPSTWEASDSASSWWPSVVKRIRAADCRLPRELSSSLSLSDQANYPAISCRNSLHPFG
jgi:hypothetical protein